MANYFNIDYTDVAPSGPSIELAYGSSTVGKLEINASLFAGDGFTATHYKIWGVGLTAESGTVTSGTAEWEAMSSSRTVYLANNSNTQYAYCKFKNAGETETDIATSNGVVFTWIEPTLDKSTEWETPFSELGFDSAVSNTLKNDTYNTSIEFDKTNFSGQLFFSGQDLTGIIVEENAIYTSADSEVGHLLAMYPTSLVGVEKVFAEDATPFITYFDGSGSFITLTDYNGDYKTSVSGTALDKIDNVSYTPGTKTLEFEVKEFSTYGFATINKIEFTPDSTEGGYLGTTIYLKAEVKDTNGEGVENAPVTFSGTGSSIGTLQAMPVYTDAFGVATASLALDTAGSVIYDASVDSYDTADDQLTYCIASGTKQRSLLTQYEQIRRSAAYDDSVANANTSAVAEPVSPTASGSADAVLEHDMNVFRTLLKQFKGTTNWYDDPGKYIDPTDTDAGDTANKDMTLDNIKGHSLDAHTLLLAIDDTNAGNGFAVSSGTEGLLLGITTRYATPDNRYGLPVFESTTNSGSYHDEGAADEVVGVDLLDMDTGAEFKDNSGDIIFGKFHDAADHAGTGTGTDVYLKFYTSAGPHTLEDSDPDYVTMVYPLRKVMSDMEEHEWTRTDFVNSFEGDAEVIEDIANLWSYTGASDNEADPAWTNISGSYAFENNPTSLFDGIETLNLEIGDRFYGSPPNFITNGETITSSLDQLDQDIKDLSELGDASIAEKYIEEVVSDIPAGTQHALPGGLTYTPDSTGGQQGSNLDIYLDGQLLSASTGANGINEDKDYSETNTTSVTFQIDIYQYSNITYKIRQ